MQIYRIQNGRSSEILILDPGTRPPGLQAAERSEYDGQTSLRSPKAHWISATCYVHLPHPVGDAVYGNWPLNCTAMKKSQDSHEMTYQACSVETLNPEAASRCQKFMDLHGTELHAC